MKDSVFKFPVMNNSDIFNTDIVAGKNGCDRSDSTGLIYDVTVNVIEFLDRPGGIARNKFRQSLDDWNIR